MVDNQNPNSKQAIPEERRFVWRNLEAYLTGEISDEDRQRIEDFLCDCSYTREYVQTEKEFAEALRRCMDEPGVRCPDGLRDRVLAALDRCEKEETAGTAPPASANGRNILRFPWMGAVFMAAASVLLVVALVMVFGGAEDLPPEPGLTQSLMPLVSRVSMDAPPSEVCHWKEASDEYRVYFPDGPELPHGTEGRPLKVSHYVCDDVEGQRVMCAVYDSADGERFGFLTFKCECLEAAAPEEMRCAELEVDGRIVLMWREQGFMRALVGDNSASLHRYMQTLRGPA